MCKYNLNADTCRVANNFENQIWQPWTHDLCDANLTYVTLMWTRFEVKMLISSSLGMTSSSGLLCSNTVSTVAKHEANFRFPVSSTERHVGMTRLINNTDDSFMTEVHMPTWFDTMTSPSKVKTTKKEWIYFQCKQSFWWFHIFSLFLFWLFFTFCSLRMSSRHYYCFSEEKKYFWDFFTQNDVTYKTFCFSSFFPLFSHPTTLLS